MSEIALSSDFKDSSGFQPDAVVAESALELVSKLREVRRLRDALLVLAAHAAGGKSQRGVLILADPEVSPSRLQQEFGALSEVFRQEVFARLAVVTWEKKALKVILGSLKGQEEEAVKELIQTEGRGPAALLRARPEIFFEVLRVLLVHWFRRAGPQPLNKITEEVGCSYPTLARALERLGGCVERHSDRRVELNSFPKEAWAQLLAQGDRVRLPLAYADYSGRPRSNAELFRRLRERSDEKLAVGGITGARHYVAGLDLDGTPRLDLVAHDLTAEEIHKRVRGLDPAFKPAAKGEVPQLVVHRLVRRNSLFKNDGYDSLWADEVECLLDLHEMKLEAQALEFIDRLKPSVIRR